MSVSNKNPGRGVLRWSTAWISNTIDWEYSSNLSLMSISSYVEYETGNIYDLLAGNNFPYWPHSQRGMKFSTLISPLLNLQDKNNFIPRIKIKFSARIPPLINLWQGHFCWRLSVCICLWIIISFLVCLKLLSMRVFGIFTHLNVTSEIGSTSQGRQKYDFQPCQNSFS